MIKNVKIYGLEDSVLRSKFPMATDIEKLDNSVTSTVNSLAKSKHGEGHDQFLTGIIVQFDLTFTLKAWTEMQRYHFVDFISSQSTMHRIAKFDLENQYTEYVLPEVKTLMKRLVEDYNKEEDPNVKKEKYLRILYNNPAGFKLTAGLTTNYRQLKTIYKQRKDHRLPEWREFCKWIESLPYSEWITN